MATSPTASSRVLQGSSSIVSIARINELAKPRGKQSFNLKEDAGSNPLIFVYDDGPSPDTYQHVQPINIIQAESKTRNAPFYTVQKSYQNPKVVISGMHKVDNLGSSSPGVGTYKHNDTQQLYKSVKKNTNFTCSFGKAHRLSQNVNDGMRSSGSGSLKGLDISNKDLNIPESVKEMTRNSSKESFQIAPQHYTGHSEWTTSTRYNKHKRTTGGKVAGAERFNIEKDMKRGAAISPGPTTGIQQSSFGLPKIRAQSQIRSSNFAAIANQSILARASGKESFRDRFKDNFKVYNKELKTDNYGIHSPGAANYNTTIGTENLQKHIIKRENANYSFPKSKRTFGERSQTLNSVVLPGPGQYEKYNQERANVGNVFGRTKRGSNLKQMSAIADIYSKQNYTDFINSQSFDQRN